jgi:hypothetical protein
VTLLVDAFVVVGGIALGRWIMRRVRRRAAARDPGTPVTARDVAHEMAHDPRAMAHEPPSGFPCKLGDVVVRVAEGDEAWLAGAMMLEEERPVAALFVAPEAGGDRAIFVRDVPGAGMTWLAPIAKDALAVTRDPPHSLELEGVRYERARRLPVRVVRVGSGVPTVGDRAIVAEYDGPAHTRLLVVAGTSETLAWKGVALTEGEYDVLPSGKETL